MTRSATAAVLDGLTPADTGTLFAYDGSVILSTVIAPAPRMRAACHEGSVALRHHEGKPAGAAMNVL